MLAAKDLFQTATTVLPVLFDAVSTVVDGATSAAPSVTHVGAAGATAFAIIATSGGSGSNTVTAVSYGGTAMVPAMPTLYQNATTDTPSFASGKIDVWKLAGIAGGSQTVTATLSGTALTSMVVISYSNVGSVTPITCGYGDSGGAAGTPAQAVTPPAGQIALGIVGASNSSSAVGTPTGGTNRCKTSNTGQPLAVSEASASATLSWPFTSLFKWVSAVLILRGDVIPVVRGANQAAATTVTIPTHAVGDLIIIYATRASTTQASKPAASGNVPTWTDINAATGANGCSSRTAYCVATSATHTSGTWTNAAALIAVVLTGVHTTPIGAHAESGAAATTSKIAPSVTMQKTNGTSTLLHFFFALGGGGTWSAPPAGYFQRTSAWDNTYVMLDTKGDTTADGAVTQTDASSVAYRGATVEVMAR